ncbi:MAG: metalloregulator ArsR/SmtB family transcription factor [Candidatus Enteromonas sp.]|jgi:DNA-binding transcriptional ArsR family regulator|nr:helix-turn-helix transcriptional regulator [Bacilli bacterium]MEE3299335.1 metalloregulator ArsR/SmtB family transcription factor [Candidatus Enteromonas sp.]MBQ2053054.1 helix-turn-helix transcriptional regulator [Bacilli bacterium]MEE3401979.1 metalloregulator ArsR/SmtB family transcription factor [Candidatus Enteromonas sp.]MEE3427283.1 metalloregulator ArsR/SmtB family transcription factor [Candidatus Enteromonas sp.]
MSKIPSDEILDRMESVLNIASDFTRLKIMYAIMKEEKSVSEIVEEVGASQSLVSHQLSVLKNADLVSTRKDGTKVFYRLADEHVDMLLKIVYEHVSEKE